MRAVGRVISISILLMILFFGGQWIVTHFKESHEIVYDFVADGTTFQVKENYQKKLGDHYYVEISLGKDQFYYEFPNLFQKGKTILSDIKMMKKDNLVCIYPVLEKESSSHNIECSRDGVLYSYQSLKNDPSVQEFVTSLKSNSFTSTSWENESPETTPAVQSVGFLNNISKQDRVIVWYYQGIEIFSSKEAKNIPLLNWDKYENTHGVLVGKYYVVPSYQSNRVFDFTQATVVDVTTTSFFTVDFPQTVSQNTYINGIVDGKVYYLDKDNVVQYELNPEKKSVRIVGNQAVNAQYYDGKWETVNIYDLVNTEKKFEVDYSKDITLQREDVAQVFESNGVYYYYTQSGDFYRIFKFFPEKSMFLFHADSPNNVVLNTDTLYYISGDTLYSYNEESGIRSLVKNNEFLYNTMNRIQAYKESKS